MACIAEPTIESAQALMKHAGVAAGGRDRRRRGGEGGDELGQARHRAGPGNPPVVVDETANVEQAGRDVVVGAAMDNNIICIVEKELFAVRSIADALEARDGAQRRLRGERRGLRGWRSWWCDDGHLNRDLVGKDARVIAEAAGHPRRGRPALLLAEVDASHPFVQLEMLMPVFPMVRVQDVEVAHPRGGPGGARLLPHRGDALDAASTTCTRWRGA